MIKLTLIFTLFFFVWNNHPPETIVGKWKIEKVEMIGVREKLPAKQLEAMDARMRKILIGNIFDFRDNKRFAMMPGIPYMPKNLKWEYNNTTGFVKITEISDIKSRIMEFSVSEKDGNIFFSGTDTPMVLTMHKLH